MKLKLTSLGMALLAFLILVACGGSPNPTLPSPAIKTYPSATFIATGVRPTLFKPLTKAECQALNDSFAVTFRVSTGMSEAPFTDPLNGDLGNGCLFAMKGTGEEFVSVPSTLESLRVMLNKAAWIEDQVYQAGGPTGGASGFRKGTALLLANVEWKPAAEAKCPADQPIASCKLTPKQQLYTMNVKVAQR